MGSIENIECMKRMGEALQMLNAIDRHDASQIKKLVQEKKISRQHYAGAGNRHERRARAAIARRALKKTKPVSAAQAV